jgi:hypothetical protein
MLRLFQLTSIVAVLLLSVHRVTCQILAPNDPTRVAYAPDQAHGPALVDELRPIYQSTESARQKQYASQQRNNEQNNIQEDQPIKPFMNREVHAFFYAWYGAPPTDKEFYHWTHGVLDTFCQ